MGKECWPRLSRPLWGGALRDDTKNACVGGYKSPLPPPPGMNRVKNPPFLQGVVDGIRIAIKKGHFKYYSAINILDQNGKMNRVLLEYYLLYCLCSNTILLLTIGFLLKPAYLLCELLNAIDKDSNFHVVAI